MKVWQGVKNRGKRGGGNRKGGNYILENREEGKTGIMFLENREEGKDDESRISCLYKKILLRRRLVKNNELPTSPADKFFR